MSDQNRRSPNTGRGAVIEGLRGKRHYRKKGSILTGGPETTAYCTL